MRRVPLGPVAAEGAVLGEQRLRGALAVQWRDGHEGAAGPDFARDRDHHAMPAAQSSRDVGLLERGHKHER